jgi:DeoR/GlpR family transcriptional regulator of sugar metabolism
MILTLTLAMIVEFGNFGEVVLINPKKKMKPLEKTIKLFVMLADGERRSVYEYAEILHVSTRTVYRYLENLQNVGVLIEKEGSGFWMSNRWKELFIRQKYESNE